MLVAGCTLRVLQSLSHGLMVLNLKHHVTVISEAFESIEMPYGDSIGKVTVSR